MNLPMKTFRFLVLIDNKIPGIIVEQRALKNYLNKYFINRLLFLIF
jgi:hypothetical protein